MPDEDLLDDELFEDNGGMSPRGFAAGLLLGAVLGAGIALLLAPDRGSRTRRELTRRLRRRRPGLRGRLELVAERAARRARERLS
jgi:gas vesicle protein